MKKKMWMHFLPESAPSTWQHYVDKHEKINSNIEKMSREIRDANVALQDLNKEIYELAEKHWSEADIAAAHRAYMFYAAGLEDKKSEQ